MSIVVDLETPLGFVQMHWTDRDHVYVDAGNGRPGVTVRGAEWPFSLHLHDYEGNGVFEPARRDSSGYVEMDPRALYCSKWEGAKNREAPRTTRAKIVEVVTGAVNDWLVLNRAVREQAQREYVEQQVESLDREIAEHEAEIERLAEERRAAVDSLRSA